MKICHKLTDEENIELYNIAKLLKSNDKESVELAVGLLENYPENAKAKYYLFHEENHEEVYSLTLKELIALYKSGRKMKHNQFFFAFSPPDLSSDPDWVIEFVMNVLINQCYYEEND